MANHEHIFGLNGCWLCGALPSDADLEDPEGRLAGLREELAARRIRRAGDTTAKLLQKYPDLYAKFLDIAERKISAIDEYGEEQMHLLPGEIDALILKIAGREGLSGPLLRKMLRDDSKSLPQWCVDLRVALPGLFDDHHRKRREQVPHHELGSLTGVEFETHIARVLRSAGFEVTGTSATGDQGADLIASKGTRRIIIQTKRYNQPVGNDAVQEVVAAIRFYSGTEGIVVTNSTFTPSARALAQKNDVKLIDRATLGQLHSI